MSQISHVVTRDGIAYQGLLTQIDSRMFEVVSRLDADGTTAEIHDADFEARLLGQADHKEYLRTMTASVLDAQERAQRFGIPLRDALDGKIESNA